MQQSSAGTGNSHDTSAHPAGLLGVQLLYLPPPFIAVCAASH